jgi:hypothetical protein
LDAYYQYNLWEYVCVCVDDLAIATKNPQQLIDSKLKAPPESRGYGYQIKGNCPLTFHLGCDYTRDKVGTLYSQPKKYITKMVESYERFFNEKPKFTSSPLEKGERPELDDSPILDATGKSIYLSVIGQLQWLIYLGQFDVAVAGLSTFRAQPVKVT